jgi:hypothetical protein
MDIHCRYCGEPWDHDELHDVEDTSYKDAVKLFLKHGCGAFGFEPPLLTCRRSPIYPPEMMELIRTAQDMSPYPDEWSSPDEIEMMLEIAEEMF